jgi:hemolysin activation/secretion protein
VLRRHLSGALLAATLAAGTASAQVGKRPGDVRPELPPLEPPAAAPELILPPIPPPRPVDEGRLGAEPRLYVRGYRFTGNTVFSSEELAQLAAPWREREVTTADLQSLRDAITLRYVEAGYVTSGAVVPDQVPQDGVVGVQIVEGALEAIEVEGPRFLRDRYVKSRLERAGGAPLDVVALEERIQLLQQDPHVERIQAELHPGSRPGLAQLRVRVEERPPWSVLLEASNHQPPSIGAYGGHFELGWNDVTGFGDALEAAFDVTEGLGEIDSRWTLPLTRWDTLLELASQLTRTDVVEESFDDVNVESETQSYGIALRQPLYTTLSTTVSAYLTGEWRRSQTFLLGDGYPFVEGPDEDGISTLALLRFGQEAVWRDRVQVIAARSQMTWGLDVLGATRNAGAEVPDGTFWAWLGQLQWARRFDSWWGIETLVRTDVQLSSGPLLGLEQFAVGGHATVRGYRENQVVRDQGLVSSLELRVPLWRDVEGRPLVQLAPFVDVGWSWNRDRPTPGPNLLPAVGVGLRWAITRFADAELVWAQNLNEALGSDDLQDYGVQFALRVRLP